MLKNSSCYFKEICDVIAKSKQLLSCFSNKRILITGIAGLIGSYVADILLVANDVLNIQCTIIGIDRNSRLMDKRFESNDNLILINHDINMKIEIDSGVDYVLHAASNTSPVDYGTKPIDTILTIIDGTKNVLDFCVKTNSNKILFCSSVESYGANIGDTDSFKEDYYNGMLNYNSTRAGYPSAKRLSESLLNAYCDEHPSLSFVTARIGRIYGPTKIPGDTKVVSQFIDNAVKGNDIVLKSDGMQQYSFGYVGDCAIALLYLLIHGKNREAYNVANPDSTMLLKDFAQAIANCSQTKVSFASQNETEIKSYSKITKATLDLSKIESLGWKPLFSFRRGIESTIKILKEAKDI